MTTQHDIGFNDGVSNEHGVMYNDIARAAHALGVTSPTSLTIDAIVKATYDAGVASVDGLTFEQWLVETGIDDEDAWVMGLDCLDDDNALGDYASF
jgi:hypothetical protein